MAADTRTAGFAWTVVSKPSDGPLQLGKRQKPGSLAVECDKLEGKVADSLCEQPSNLYFPLEVDKKDHCYQAYRKGADECNKRCLGDEGAESQGD